MKTYSNKQAFALVTVLMVLVLLLILSTGIIISSYIGIQRSTVFQDSNISYINAMSGSNIVLSYFDNLDSAPVWEAEEGGDLGNILPELPSAFQDNYSLEFQDASGHPVQGVFRVIRADRIGGIRNSIPQDFEIIVAGYTMDGGNLSNEVFLRTRIRLGSDSSDFNYAYFTHKFNTRDEWVGTYGDIYNNVPAVRFVGKVHSNQQIRIQSTKQSIWEHDLDPRYPMFTDWRWKNSNDMSHVLSVAHRERDAVHFEGGNIKDWDDDNEYSKYIWGENFNPNIPWFGLAGYNFFNKDEFGDPIREDITYGGYNAMEFDVDEIPFPEVDPNIRSLIWNGTETGTVPSAPDLDSPDRVRIPDSSRPNGGIYIYGDASIRFEENGQVPGTSNIYNNKIIIEQPHEETNGLLRWDIYITRNSDGLITKIDRYDHINEDTVSYSYINPIEDIGIYVDGNIGWMEGEDGQGNNVFFRRSYLSNWDKEGDGTGNRIRDKYIEDDYFRGLEGDSFGKFTIAARGDILITNNLMYLDYNVPITEIDYLNESFENLNSLNTIIGRNVYVVPRMEHFGIPTGNPEDYFNIDAIIFATGLNQNNPDNSLVDRDIGTFASIMHYSKVGNTGDNNTGANRGASYGGDADVMGVMNLRGASISYTAGIFGRFGPPSSFRGMFMHHYFDQRIPLIGSPYIITGSTEFDKITIFESVRINQI